MRWSVYIALAEQIKKKALLLIRVRTADIKLTILYLIDCPCSLPKPASGCAVHPTNYRKS